MNVTQAEFRAALLDASLPPPDGLTNGYSGPAGVRFSVYRNNVVLSLQEALETAFPLVHKLIGAKNFAQLSGHFVRLHPPSSPLMMFYGEEFPAFLRAFQPLQKFGYLHDCARLDLILRQSYHAADATAVSPDVFATAAQLSVLKLKLAPASFVLRSRWPVFDLWRYNMVPNSPAPRAEAQDVLVTRQALDPKPHLLPDGAADWIMQLDGGQNFAKATDRAVAETAGFDLTRALSLSLKTEAFIQDH